MVVFLLKSSACLAIFLMFYKLLLEKERIHTFKRYYLLASVVLSFTIPSITFIEYVEVAPVSTSYEVIETIPMETVTPMVIEEATAFDWSIVLWGIYFLGVVFFLLRFLKNLFDIAQNIRNNPKLRFKTLINVLLQEATVPHTFFNYIFLERKKYEANAIPKEVLLHEAAHAKQKHSLDILFVEMLQLIFWFNPLVYLTKNAIKLNHEFLADQAVLESGASTPDYQNTLLSFASSTNAKDNQSNLANAVNYSSIKKRFTVMKTRTSKKSVLTKSLLLLPLLAILLYSFIETETVNVENEPITKDNSTMDSSSTNRNIVGSSDTENEPKRSVELAGLILDAETLKPMENVEIYSSNGNILSKTDRRGYYKVQFDELGQGEIKFEFSLRKDGYKTLAQREHWGNLNGKIASTNYYGLQKKESSAPEFSQHIPNNRNLSYGSVLSNFHLVKIRFEFNKKLDNAKKDNQHILFEIDNTYYLVNDTGLIKIGSKDDLISIDDKRIVRASEVNGLIERKEITGMTPLDTRINSAKYAIYTIPVDHAVRPIKTQIQTRSKKQRPTEKDFEKWKNKKEFAIWIHEKPVDNSVLNEHRPSDFAHYFLSFVHLNARSERFPQPYQLHLYTEDEFKKNVVKDNRLIKIMINRNGQLLVQSELVELDNLASYLLKLNKHLPKEERQKAVVALIVFDKSAPKKVIETVEQIFKEYGVAQIDIRGSEDMPSPNQNGATQKQLSKYNTLAKKYNAQPKAERVIPSEDLKSLELIYRKMSEKQKADAQPFPECSNPKSNQQEGATEYQMAEYNALAKKYNEMLADGGNIRIKKSDVDRLVYLDGLMTKEQRVSAEPFPDFPEPPEPPVPPSAPNLSDKEMADEVIEYIIANQDPGDYTIGLSYIGVKRGKLQEFIGTYPKANSYFHVKSEANTIYHNGKKISYLEMMQMQKDGEIKTINVFKNANGQNAISITRQNELTKPIPPQNLQNSNSVSNYTYKPEESNGIAIGALNVSRGSVRITAGGRQLQEGVDYTVNYQAGMVQIINPSIAAINTPIKIKVLKNNFEKGISSPPAPPAPLKPKAPLDYVIEMAKIAARFYYEGKEISSDKAIDFMKKNKNLNIDSRREKGKRPIVKLSKEPIVID